MNVSAKNGTKSFWFILAKIGFFSLAFYFVFSLLVEEDWSRLNELELNTFALIIAVVFALAFRALSSFSWVFLLEQIAPQTLPKLPILFNVYANAWMGRYIPGKAALVLGKVVFASQYGISKRDASVTSLYEVIAQLLITLAVSCLVLAFDQRALALVSFTQISLIYLFLAVIVICILTVSGIFYKYSTKLHDLPFRLSRLLSTIVVLQTVLLYAVAALLSALSYLALTASFLTIELHDIAFVMAVFSFSGVIGTLALFAPAGLGVREGLQTVLLSLIIPVEQALVLAVLARLFSTACDLLFFVSAKAWHKHYQILK